MDITSQIAACNGTVEKTEKSSYMVTIQVPYDADGNRLQLPRTVFGFFEYYTDAEKFIDKRYRAPYNAELTALV